MANVMKYWVLLESLKFQEDPESCSESERIQKNTEILQKAIQLSPTEILKDLIEDLELIRFKSEQDAIITEANTESIYCIYSSFVVRQICKNTNFLSIQAEDLISENHKSMLVACMDDIVEYGLKWNLHSAFYKCKDSIFCKKAEIKSANLYRTEFMVEIFSSFIQIQTLLCAGQTSEEAILCYMAAIFSLFIGADLKEYSLEQIQITSLQLKLLRIWTDISKVLYYRNLMLFYGILPPAQKPRIHKDMLFKLWSSGGFVALLFALQKSEKRDEQPIAEVVAKLVAQPSYSKKAQLSLVQQIFSFLKSCISNKDMLPYMGVGVTCLRKLYDNNDENKDLVKNWIKQQIQPLLEIQEERITVIEWKEFTNMICLLFQMFCTSTIECLPSELLISYLPILLDCHQHISNFGSKHNVVCSHLSYLTLRILNNRGRKELETIIKYIITNAIPSEWWQKHPNISIEEYTLNSEDLRIVQKETEFETNTLFSSYMNSLATILKDSSFTTLSYQIFIIIFRLLPTLEVDETPSSNNYINSDFLQSEDDIENAVTREITRRYNGKIQAINALQILNEHKPLKILIIENIKDILIILQEMLTMFTKSADENAEAFNKSVIMILLTLIREIVENAFVKLEEVNGGAIEDHLVKLEKKVCDKNLKYKILCLLQQIQNKSGKCDNIDTSKERFEEARSLVESKESYIQVEGIEKLLKLIKEKDEFTINNVHVVTALTLNTLKSAESYTFLNCVRLFVSLVSINEHMILETLADDYLNESSSTDYRLLVGEALLRVCKEIGQLCYKYKALLLNAFMYGCRSPLDEFRFSSFSNLSQMCKILSFQVHNFFQELLHLINCELTTGKYLPAKRAAVVVLSDLLAGMDNLIDYEEMLLPIYRLLKFLASSECTDEKMRLHAQLGLETLAAKCKELLMAASQQTLEKEIKIMGIKDNPKGKLRNHILYMN